MSETRCWRKGLVGLRDFHETLNGLGVDQDPRLDDEGERGQGHVDQKKCYSYRYIHSRDHKCLHEICFQDVKDQLRSLTMDDVAPGNIEVVVMDSSVASESG